MADIVITEFMDADVVEALSGDFETVYDTGLADDRAKLLGLVAGCRGLIVRNRTQVDAELIAAAANLKVVGRLGVGLDNIDLEAAKARSVEVCPAHGANAASVAEYVLTAWLHLLRPISSATAPMLAGKFPRAEFSDGKEIGGRTLGLIGGGMIGREVARRVRPLGVGVLVSDPALEGAGGSTGDRDADWEVVGLEDCLGRADAVSLHVPLTDETRGFLGAARLNQMKPGAVLINTARGGIVDHAALAERLKSGRLGGAAIDVFEEEPASAKSLAMFKGLGNVILTPHVAGLTQESNIRVSEMTAVAVRAVLERG